MTELDLALGLWWLSLEPRRDVQGEKREKVESR